MSRPWQEEKVRAWADYVLSAVDSSVTVVYSNQRGPRPEFPYATLNFLSDVQRGGYPELVVTDTELPSGKVATELHDHRQGTFRVSLYGDGELIKLMAKALDKSLFDPELYTELLAKYGVAVLRLISSIDSSFIDRRVGVEEQIVTDFEFAWREETAGEVQVIETVDATKIITA